MFKNNSFFSIIVAASLFTANNGHAQEETTYTYADEITVIQGYSPGGGTDALAQLTQPYLAKYLGVNFVNSYVPGASGAIAWTRLAQQTRGDGRTIGILNGPMIVTNYIMNQDLNYRLEDLRPIANVVFDPSIVVVAANSPYKSFEDFIQDAQNNPNQITVGNAGVGATEYFAQLQLMRLGDIELRLVPFNGDGPSMTATMGGKIDASFANVSLVKSQVEAGNLRPLAVISEERTPAFPDVPTFKELGYDMVSGSTRGYAAPADISEEAVQQLESAFLKLAEDEEFLAVAEARSISVDIRVGQDYQALLEETESIGAQLWEEVNPN